MYKHPIKQIRRKTRKPCRKEAIASAFCPPSCNHAGKRTYKKETQQTADSKILECLREQRRKKLKENSQQRIGIRIYNTRGLRIQDSLNLANRKGPFRSPIELPADVMLCNILPGQKPCVIGNIQNGNPIAGNKNQHSRKPP